MSRGNSTTRDIRRSRLSLLWLLPYLFMSFGGAALHSHAPGDEHENQQLSETHCVSKTQHHVHHDGRLGHHPHECFACQWTAHSSGQLALPAASYPYRQAEVITPAESSAIRSAFLLTRAPRGPPLS